MRRYNVASPAFDFGGFWVQSEAEALDLCADLGGYILQLAGKAPLTGFYRPQKLDLNELSITNQSPLNAGFGW